MRGHIRFALAFLTFAPSAAAAQAALKDSVPHISVVGHASTEVMPDIATISLAVETEKPTAAEAAAANASAAQALVAAIKSQGIEGRDIQTISVTLSPDYEDDASRTKTVLRGYIARNSLAVRVHAVDKAGAIARRLIDAGANQVEDVSFGYEHADDAYDKLRDEAVRDALRRAKDYLPSVGLSLGRVLEIAPMEGNVGLSAAPRAAAYARAAETSIPLEPGTITLQTDVQVTWELTH